MPAGGISVAAIRTIRPKARIVSSPLLPMVRHPTCGLTHPPPMHDPAAHERMQRLTGIALMCGAVMCFALLDTMAKYLNLHMSTLQVVWARYTGAFLFPFMFSNPWTRPQLLITARPVLQIANVRRSQYQPVQLCPENREYSHARVQA